MRFLRVFVCLALLIFCSSFSLTARSKKFTVLGTLTEEVTTGDENAAWTIQLNPVIMVDGMQISSLEIKSSDTHKLESLKDQSVQATGTILYASALKTDQRPILKLISIKLRKLRLK